MPILMAGSGGFLAASCEGVGRNRSSWAHPIRKVSITMQGSNLFNGDSFPLNLVAWPRRGSGGVFNVGITVSGPAGLSIWISVSYLYFTNIRFFCIKLGCAARLPLQVTHMEVILCP